MGSLSCEINIPGWQIHFARIFYDHGDFNGVMSISIRGAIQRLEKRFANKTFEQDEILHTVKTGLREISTESESFSPPSEDLAKKILKGSEFPRSNPCLELVNLLMLETMLPWSIVDYSKVQPPFKFHLSENWNKFLNFENNRPNIKEIPVISDKNGIIGTPLSLTNTSQITTDTSHLLYICYIPEVLDKKVNPASILGRIVVQTWAFRFGEEMRIR